MALGEAAARLAAQQTRLQQYAGVGVMLFRRAGRIAARRCLRTWQAAALAAARDRETLAAAGLTTLDWSRAG